MVAWMRYLAMRMIVHQFRKCQPVYLGDYLHSFVTCASIPRMLRRPIYYWGPGLTSRDIRHSKVHLYVAFWGCIRSMPLAQVCQFEILHYGFIKRKPLQFFWLHGWSPSLRVRFFERGIRQNSKWEFSTFERHGWKNTSRVFSNEGSISGRQCSAREVYIYVYAGPARQPDRTIRSTIAAAYEWQDNPIKHSCNSCRRHCLWQSWRGMTVSRSTMARTYSLWSMLRKKIRTKAEERTSFILSDSA
jgi:hypothetical protein